MQKCFILITYSLNKYSHNTAKEKKQKKWFQMRALFSF